jgi:hypothetical protein
MTTHSGPGLPTEHPSPSPPDLSREQVIDIYKQAGDAELRRHIPIMQTDGKGFIGFLCGCGSTYSHDAWWLHLQTRLKRATKR